MKKVILHGEHISNRHLNGTVKDALGKLLDIRCRLLAKYKDQLTEDNLMMEYYDGVIKFYYNRPFTAEEEATKKAFHGLSYKPFRISDPYQMSKGRSIRRPENGVTSEDVEKLQKYIESRALSSSEIKNTFDEIVKLEAQLDKERREQDLNLYKRVGLNTGSEKDNNFT